MYLNTLFGQETIEQKSKGAHSAETDRAALPSPSSLARRRSARSGAWFARGRDNLLFGRDRSRKKVRSLQHS